MDNNTSELFEQLFELRAEDGALPKYQRRAAVGWVFQFCLLFLGTLYILVGVTTSLWDAFHTWKDFDDVMREILLIAPNTATTGKIASYLFIALAIWANIYSFNTVRILVGRLLSKSK